MVYLGSFATVFYILGAFRALPAESEILVLNALEDTMDQHPCRLEELLNLAAATS